jgi:peroxiredoxin 2/4
MTMKKLVLIVSLILSVTSVWSQEVKYVKVPLVGEEAPSFTAASTKGTVNFPGDYGRKWKVLFSHPQDFTPVCSSELIELAHAQGEFDKLNAALAVVSTDQLSQHEQWKKAMEEIDYQGKGKVKINFPLIEDNTHVIAKAYGMIHPGNNSTKDVRGVFIIDPDNIIQSIFFYPNNVGRNIAELERTLAGLQTARSSSVLIPANWQKGNDVLIPLERLSAEKGKTGTKEASWFMAFKKLQ